MAIDEGHDAIRHQIEGVRTELLSEIRRVEQVQTERHEQNVARLDDVEHILGGNGQPGIVKILTEFIADSKARDDERKMQQAEVKDDLEKHNQKQTNKYNRIMIIIAILGLAVAWLTYVDTRSAAKNGVFLSDEISNIFAHNGTTLSSDRHYHIGVN